MVRHCCLSQYISTLVYTYFPVQLEIIWETATGALDMPANTLCALNMEYVQLDEPVADGDSETVSRSGTVDYDGCESEDVVIDGRLFLDVWVSSDVGAITVFQDR